MLEFARTRNILEQDVPLVLCRKENANEEREKEADRFASLLLMPEWLIHNAWQDFSSSTKSKSY